MKGYSRILEMWIDAGLEHFTEFAHKSYDDLYSASPVHNERGSFLMDLNSDLK